MTDESQLVSLFDQCSNAGRWGSDDELGTLNYITDEKRRAAAGLVQTGKAVAIGRALSTQESPANARPLLHLMLLEQDPDAATDYVGLAPHGLAITHLDAVGHVFWEGHAYNGRRSSDICSSRGLSFASIHAQRQGIFTRGVLLDIAACRGLRWLPAAEFVTREDIELAEKRQDVRVDRGDAVFLHVGAERREIEEGDSNPWVRAGVDGSVIGWLHERGVAVYSGDCIERLPYPSSRFPLPLHQVGLAAMGLCLLDNPTMTELVDVCAELGRSEFLLTCAPPDLPGGTGAAVNPLCLF